MIIGVDPGTSGMLVCLKDNFEFVAALPMPTIKIGSKTRVNGAAIAGWIGGLKWDHTDNWHAFIEQVNAMPSGPAGSKRTMGAASAFTFGHNAGLVEGVLTGAGIPITLIHSQTWKKATGLTGTEKDAARSRAVQLYPEVRMLDLKGKGQALADAMFIARAGFKKMSE